MLQIDITPEICAAAEKLADHKVYKRSMRGKEANLVGAYGEAIVYDYLVKYGMSPVFAHKTTHDIECSGYKIDVKTKERTVAPKPYYDCTVPAYNHEHQKPDTFIFVSLLSKPKGSRRFSSAWILGSISYKQLTQKAKLWKAGEVDPNNGWSATIDCYNVPISLLKPPVVK